jgi:hypothetical protein
MKPRTMASAILGLAALGASTLAAMNSGLAADSGRLDERVMGMTPHMECISLEKQFDTAIKNHVSAARAAEARSLRSDAGKLCASGKSSDGIVKLQHAFEDLGVIPTKG